jgi:hypothetical protein
MVGMAQKPKTRRGRLVALCALIALLIYCALDIHKFHGMLRFGTGVTIALALMEMLRELRQLLEEPN